MRNIRFWVIAALLALPVFAQAPVQVGGWPTNTTPSVYARFLEDDGCPTMNPCLTGTTGNVPLVSLMSASNFQSGTVGNAAQIFMGPGTKLDYGSGTLDANELAGGLLPSNAPLWGSNVQGAPIPITPAGCVNVASSQVYDQCSRLPSYTIGSNLPTCNSTPAPAGTQYTQAVVLNGVAVPVYLATVSTTGSTVAPVFCNGTNWVYH